MTLEEQISAARKLRARLKALKKQRDDALERIQARAFEAVGDCPVAKWAIEGDDELRELAIELGAIDLGVA